MKHILVVDDEQNILTLFEDELTEAGYRVSLANSGLAALKKVDEDKPDLVILDIRMPNMHGLEVLERIREKDEHLPVLMCTALQGMRDDFTVVESKISGYLTKPVDLDELRAKVKEIIGE